MTFAVDWAFHNKDESVIMEGYCRLSPKGYVQIQPKPSPCLTWLGLAHAQLSLGWVPSGAFTSKIWTRLESEVEHHYPELPMTHSPHIFEALEPIFTPFKSVLCVELTL